MKILQQVFILLCALYLMGCSISKEQFDCKYGVGVGCKSITEVNGMVNKGLGKSGNTSNINLSAPISANNKKLNHEKMEVERVTEEHLRIWVAPFQDEEGRFHEGSVVHTVLRPGFWQINEGGA